MKTAGLAPHSILLIKGKGIQGFLKVRKERKKRRGKALKKAIQRRGALYLLITKKQRSNSPQGGRKSIHLRRASLYFRLIR